MIISECYCVCSQFALLVESGAPRVDLFGLCAETLIKVTDLYQ